MHSSRSIAKRKCLGSWIMRYVGNFLQALDAGFLNVQINVAARWLEPWAISLMVQCRQEGRQDINQPAIKLYLLCAMSEPYTMKQHLENASDAAVWLEKGWPGRGMGMGMLTRSDARIPSVHGFYTGSRLNNLPFCSN